MASSSAMDWQTKCSLLVSVDDLTSFPILIQMVSSASFVCPPTQSFYSFSFKSSVDMYRGFSNAGIYNVGHIYG